jgi:hypothetical protein
MAASSPPRARLLHRSALDGSKIEASMGFLIGYIAKIVMWCLLVVLLIKVVQYAWKVTQWIFRKLTQSVTGWSLS